MATHAQAAGPGHFNCPECGQSFAWADAMAGRTLQCACGAKLKCPARCPDEPEDYELAPDPQPRAVSDPEPSSTQQHPNVRTLNYRAPRDETPAPSDPQRIKDFSMPLWLLGSGVGIHVIAAMLAGWPGMVRGLAEVAVGLVVSTALMLAGILIAAKARGISLGPLRSTVFKLAAISVAPSAAVVALGPVLRMAPFGLGLFVGWIGEFVLYFALLGALFDLDESDTWYCVCVIFLVNLAVYFGLLWMGLHLR